MKITKYIEFTGEVTEFLGIVKNFGKKFFTTSYQEKEKNIITQRIVAIGVSRELTYKIVWDIPCYDTRDKYTKMKSERPLHYWEMPLNKLEPLNDETEKYLYPYKQHSPETKESECSWVNVFHDEGFIDVNIIED